MRDSEALLLTADRISGSNEADRAQRTMKVSSPDARRPTPYFQLSISLIPAGSYWRG
jgi:hypothetical protein